jgi:hypothetical protein
MSPQLPSAGRRRRRQTLAPRPLSPVDVPTRIEETSGSRFSCLGSDSGGSETEVESIPVLVALHALDEEVRTEEGWTPVHHRRRKPMSETIDNFWREIGYPTPLTRHWEKARRSSPPAGKSGLFCRSVDVLLAEDVAGSMAGSSPPSASVSRGAFSSPSGIHLSRGPRMGPWRGPLPRRRIMPPPMLGQFLDMATPSSSSAIWAPGSTKAGSAPRAASTPSSTPVTPLVSGAETVPAPITDGVIDGAQLHAANLGRVHA